MQQLTIQWDEATGAISVNGPIDNKVLAFGLLEAGKDAIREYIAKKSSDSRIMAPNAIDLATLRGK